MFTMGGLETIFSSEGYFRGRPTAVGAGTGAIIGLVGITPGCGFVSPMWSIFIGAATCAAVFAVPKLVRKCGVDDSLDCFAIHGVGGLVGTLLTGLLANADVSGFGAPSVFSGGFFGNSKLLAIQIAATLITFVYSAFFTTVIYWFLYLFATRVFGTDIRLRGEQSNDPDASLHGETGYAKASAKPTGSPTSSLTFPLERILDIGEPTSTASEVTVTVPAPATAEEVRA
jgi:Amt family ammonium transporter